ncbi:MAG: acyl-CoA dehydrogenase family protein [Myxococcales bacterium]|nr:acyl-CoA dehydrogenase family protein [Myxococcales bacterium]MCB9643071.1 acyl-CoA dehydrogenase family protein [Myxococcales bacterium]
MQLELGAEESLIIEQVRDFARKELSSLSSAAEHQEQFSRESIEALGSYGLLSMRIPEAFGGTEMDPVTCCRVLMELAWVDASLAVIVALQNAWGVEFVNATGSDEQKALWLGALAEGALIACGGEGFACEAGGARGNTGLLRVQHQGDSWRLEGEAHFVSLGGEAELLLLGAVDEQGEIHSFVLEGDARKQVIAKPFEGKLGLRGTEVAHLALHGVVVPDSARLANCAEAADAWAFGRVALAAVSVGVAQAALWQSLQYAQQRKQFSQPISSFQAIQWKLADMAMKAEAAQVLVDHAADLWQRGEMEALEDAGRQARLFAAEMAVWAGQEAIQIHGGYGFIREFPVERYYRDAQTLRARWGGASAQQHAIAERWWRVA